MVGAGLAVLLVGAVAWWWPYVTFDHDYPTTIPQPLPLTRVALVELGPGGSTCIQPVILGARSGRAWVRIGTLRGTGQPLRLTLAGPGYTSVSDAPGGYADNAVVALPVREPGRDLVVRACLANTGTRHVFVYASDDQTRAPMSAKINGVETAPVMDLAFYEAKPTSIAHRLPSIFAWMQRFRPGFMGPWLFWPLALLCVVGLPLGALWAVGRGFALEEDDGAAGPDAEPARAPAVDRPEGPQPAGAGADR